LLEADVSSEIADATRVGSASTFQGCRELDGVRHCVVVLAARRRLPRHDRVGGALRYAVATKKNCSVRKFRLAAVIAIEKRAV